MSYRWKQKTSPLTSIVLLQKALSLCGFGTKVSSKMLDRLAAARGAVESAASSEQRIAALEGLHEAIVACNETSSLPKTIQLEGLTLKFTNSRYTAEGYSSDYSKSDEERAKELLSKLTEAYRQAARELMEEDNEALGRIESERERQSVIATIRAERESYRKSVQDFKDQANRLIEELAREKGTTVKRNVFTKGKNAGRVQLVVVRR